MRKTTHGLLRGTTTVTAGTLLGLFLAGTAVAKGGEPGDDNAGGTMTAGSSGNYSVTVNGATYDPAPGRDANVSGRVSGVIRVAGVHTTFTIDPATLGVYDYSLTGAPSPERMVTSPTVVFAS